jgi:hypothetical protein
VKVGVILPWLHVINFNIHLYEQVILIRARVIIRKASIVYFNSTRYLDDLTVCTYTRNAMHCRRVLINRWIHLYVIINEKRKPNKIKVHKHNLYTYIEPRSPGRPARSQTLYWVTPAPLGQTVQNWIRMWRIFIEFPPKTPLDSGHRFYGL